MTSVQLAWLCVLAIAATVTFCVWGNALEADEKNRTESTRDSADTGRGTE